MKINIANPATGQQKTFEIDDEHKVKHMYEKRISHEVSADPLGDEFKGYSENYWKILKNYLKFLSLSIFF